MFGGPLLISLEGSREVLSELFGEPRAVQRFAASTALHALTGTGRAECNQQFPSACTPLTPPNDVVVLVMSTLFALLSFDG